jgi:hypothetical protein
MNLHGKVESMTLMADDKGTILTADFRRGTLDADETPVPVRRLAAVAHRVFGVDDISEERVADFLRPAPQEAPPEAAE